MSQNKLHVRKGDRVKVIAGKDKGAGRRGHRRLPRASQGDGHRREHRQAPPQGHVRPAPGPPTTKGGIVSSEAPIHASNVQLVVKNDKGDEVVTRVGYDRAEVTKRRADGTEYKSTRSVRIARVTGEEI